MIDKELLEKYNAEVIPSMLGICFVTPEKVPPEVQQELNNAIGTKLIFQQGIKPSSVQQIQRALDVLGTKQAAIRSNRNQAGDRHLSLELESDSTENVEILWTRICEIMSRDGYYKSWEMGDRKWNPTVSNAVASNKVRDRGITNNDLLDLTIILGAAKDVNEVIASL